MKQILLVGLGGFFGSALRYGVALWSQKWIEGFPGGTLLVNLIGSLLIGLLVGLSLKQGQQGYSLLAIGFCGGFTTFSSFALENIRLIKAEQWTLAIGYASVSLIGAVACCAVGIWIGNKIL